MKTENVKFLPSLPQVVLQGIKKSFEGAHWDAKIYWKSPASLWNSKTVNILMLASTHSCFVLIWPTYSLLKWIWYHGFSALIFQKILLISQKLLGVSKSEYRKSPELLIEVCLFDWTPSWSRESGFPLFRNFASRLGMTFQLNSLEPRNRPIQSQHQKNICSLIPVIILNKRWTLNISRGSCPKSPWSRLVPSQNGHFLGTLFRNSRSVYFAWLR